MPIRPSKHTVLLDTLPKALEGVRKLREDGHNDLADAVQHVADYARDNAKAETAAAAARPTNNKALSVSQDFKTHVMDVAAAEQMKLRDVVEQSLEDFLSGEWTPAPPVRGAHGPRDTQVNLNVRVDTDLWARANHHGKDPAAITARGGYTLTASQVALAALEETFDWPGATDTAGS